MSETELHTPIRPTCSPCSPTRSHSHWHQDVGRSSTGLGLCSAASASSLLDQARRALDSGDWLDSSEWLKSSEFLEPQQQQEAPPDAPNEKDLIEIFNMVQEKNLVEMDKRSKTKSSMSDHTLNELHGFFDHTDIRYNSNKSCHIRPDFPGLKYAALAQGIDSSIIKKGIERAQLTAAGISLLPEDEERLIQTLDHTRNVKWSESIMRDKLWDTLIFKKPTEKWWRMRLRVERFVEYRIQILKCIDIYTDIPTTAGLKRGQKLINPAGAVVRFPSRIISPAQTSLSPTSMPNKRLPKKNVYNNFDIVYLLIDRHFLRGKPRKTVFSLPVARLFLDPENEDFHCCPHILVEIKPYHDSKSYNYTMDKAVTYLTLNASAILFEWLKLLWLGAGAQEFEVSEHLQIHMFAAVSHTVRHLFCRIRPDEKVGVDRVRYETVQGREYDLTDELQREEFNLMHQYIQAHSHLYGNMYKEAIDNALKSGISPATTDSDEIYFAYARRKGTTLYMMKHGNPTYMYLDETYPLLDEAGKVIGCSDESSAVHGLGEIEEGLES